MGLKQRHRPVSRAEKNRTRESTGRTVKHRKMRPSVIEIKTEMPSLIICN